MSKPLSKKRKLQFTIISIVLTLLVLWGIGEVIFRALVFVRGQGYPTATTEIDDKLGWKAVPNFDFSGIVQDGAGNDYQLDFKTDENGFRYFGDNKNPDNKRLLVIGDSYTHAIEVSANKTYYGLLKDSLQKVELFAYGARGVGPLQQFLWLEEWYPIIEPDAVLWQFCFNDLFNGSYALESTSYFNNNRRTRPYWEDGKVVYNNPARLGLGGLRESSKFLDFMLTKMEVFIEGQDHKKQIASEDMIEGMGKKYKPYSASLETLDEVIKKVKGLMDRGMAIVAFPVDDTQPYLKDMTEIFRQNGIPVISQIPEIVRQADKNGTSVWAKDMAHWNEKAHEIAAEEIWKSLKPVLFYKNTGEELSNE